jgi:hypothetical protein
MDIRDVCLHDLLDGNPKIRAAMGLRAKLPVRVVHAGQSQQLVCVLTRRDWLKGVILQSVFSLAVIVVANIIAHVARVAPGTGAGVSPLAADPVWFGLISLGAWVLWSVVFAGIAVVLTPPSKHPKIILEYTPSNGMVTTCDRERIARDSIQGVGCVQFYVRNGGVTGIFHGIVVKQLNRWRVVFVSRLYPNEAVAEWCGYCGLNVPVERVGTSAETIVKW